MIRNKKNSFVILFLVFVLLLSSRCADKKPKKELVVTQEMLININKQLVNRDNDSIKAYIAEHHLQMSQTQTGLWYVIEDDLPGSLIKNGDIVSYNYTISLIDGTVCYTSDQTGPKTIVIGKGGAEVGVTEALRLLNRGDVASLILPPHLAHDLIGDDNKIPSRSILLVNLEVIEVK